jgi:hypothetical protein
MVELFLSMSNKTPDVVFQITVGGGAMVVDENGVKVGFAFPPCFYRTAFIKHI